MQEVISHTIHSSTREVENIIRSMDIALKTYANTKRGYGAFPTVTEALVLRARKEVLNYLNLDQDDFVVVFASPLGAVKLKEYVGEGFYMEVSSSDVGLPLGLRALAIPKHILPASPIDHVGGGTVKLVNKKLLVWADAPDRFEAGTKSIVNIIAFASALMHRAAFFDCHAPASSYQDGKSPLNDNPEQVIGPGKRVPAAEGWVPYVHLDHASSTPAFTIAWDSVKNMIREPETDHTGLIQDTKAACFSFFGASPETYEFLFTSNTTESINIAAGIFSQGLKDGTIPVVVNTILEHHSNEIPWRFCSEHEIIRLPVNADGMLNLNDLEYLLFRYNKLKKFGKREIRLISLAAVSNVLGSCPDIRKIGEIAHRYGAFLMVDGAQCAGHRALSIERLGIDCFVFSGHKMYAPFGSGGLIIRNDLMHIPERELSEILESGEENLVGISALRSAIGALELIGMEHIEAREKQLTRLALKLLRKIPGVKVYGIQQAEDDSPVSRGSIISFSVRHLPHNLVARLLSEHGGIGVRNGCLCAHLGIKRILGISRFRAYLAHLLTKLIPEEIIPVLPGVVRISFGIDNKPEDVIRFIQVLRHIVSEPAPLIHRIFALFKNGSPFIKDSMVQAEINDLADSIVDSVFHNEEHETS